MSVSDEIEAWNDISYNELDQKVEELQEKITQYAAACKKLYKD